MRPLRSEYQNGAGGRGSEDVNHEGTNDTKTHEELRLQEFFVSSWLGFFAQRRFLLKKSSVRCQASFADASS